MILLKTLYLISNLQGEDVYMTRCLSDIYSVPLLKAELYGLIGRV